MVEEHMGNLLNFVRYAVAIHVPFRVIVKLRDEFDDPDAQRALPAFGGALPGHSLLASRDAEGTLRRGRRERGRS